MGAELITREQAETELAPVLSGLDILEQGTGQILSLIPSLSDEHLMLVLEASDRLEQCSWVVRASVVSEIRKRDTSRQSGGRGNKDEAGTGIKAQLAALAQRRGVSVRTLEAEAQAVEIFDIESGAVDGIPLLPKSFYIEALNAPDPQAAIEMATQKRDEGNFTTAAFRVAIQQDRRKDEGSLYEPSQTPANEKYLTCPVDAEIYDALDKMATQERLNLRFMVEKAILTLQALTLGHLQPVSDPDPASPYAVEFTPDQHALLVSAWVNSGQDNLNLEEFITRSVVDPLTGMLYDNATPEQETYVVQDCPDLFEGSTVQELLADPEFVRAARAIGRDAVVCRCDLASRDTAREAWRSVRSGVE